MSSTSQVDLAVRAARLIEGVSGNVIPEGQYPFLADLILRSAKRAGFADPTAYLESLGSGRLETEWEILLPAITVNESFLFRVPEQFTAFSETVVSRLVGNGRPTRPLAVWSAACAGGEEPATLAIVLAERLGLEAEWRVLGTDLDHQVLASARQWTFAGRSVGRVPPELLGRWFGHSDRAHVLDRRLQERISLRRLNLLEEPFPDLGGPFDVIFLRNVLIYFRPEAQREVLARIRSQLRPEGYLFLGHSESLWKLDETMEAVDFGDCFAYRRPSSSSPAPAPTPRPRLRPRVSAPKRRAQPSNPRHSREEVAGGPAPAPNGSDLRPQAVFEVPIRRPAPATTTVNGAARTAPPSALSAAEALAANRPAEARNLVELRLGVDAEDAQAHALEGLLHDLEKRGEDAVAAYRAALFLDGSLYQIRLLLADEMERLGWLDRARTEYRQTLTVLDNGSARPASDLSPLPLATPEDAAERCRRALRRL